MGSSSSGEAAAGATTTGAAQWTRQRSPQLRIMSCGIARRSTAVCGGSTFAALSIWNIWSCCVRECAAHASKGAMPCYDFVHLAHSERGNMRNQAPTNTRIHKKPRTQAQPWTWKNFLPNLTQAQAPCPFPPQPPAPRQPSVVGRQPRGAMPPPTYREDSIFSDSGRPGCGWWEIVRAPFAEENEGEGIEVVAWIEVSQTKQEAMRIARTLRRERGGCWYVRHAIAAPQEPPRRPRRR